MPFVTACSFCSQSLKVPDQALGASLRCPKCGDYFTVARSETPLPTRKPPRPHPPPKAAPAPVQPASSADQPWWVASPPQPPAPPPVPETPPAPASMLVPSPPLGVHAFPPPPPMPVASSLPPWINAWGVFAFTLAALALVFAAFGLPRFLTIILTALGLLLGLVGFFMTEQDWRLKDGIWLGVGGGGNALLLLAALFWPGWLNERWGRDFVVPEPEQNQLLLVSRDNNNEVKELSESERVDAQTHALRLGGCFVRIDRAELTRAREKQPVLVLHLHLENISPIHEISYHGQASPEHRASARDSRGHPLKPLDLDSKDKRARPVATVSLLPMHEVEDVLAVEAPWPGTANVEVDLPAAAWGKEGVARFTVPSGWIQNWNRNP